jgi:hypothetical protein
MSELRCRNCISIRKITESSATCRNINSNRKKVDIYDLACDLFNPIRTFKGISVDRIVMMSHSSIYKEKRSFTQNSAFHNPMRDVIKYF